MKTLFLADREYHVRNAIRLAINNTGLVELAGEADHVESLVAQVCQFPPDIILMDWHLPTANHQRLILTLREHCPKTRIYVMSVKPEDELIIQDYQVDGFVSKQNSPDAFIQFLQGIVDNNNLEKEDQDS